MSSPDFNPYAPPEAELRDITPAPNGCVRVGSLFVVKKGSEGNVPADSCVCCGQPSAAVKVRTYTRRPDWLGLVLFCGIVATIAAPMPWSAFIFIAVIMGGLYGIALTQKTRVGFGECGRHRRNRLVLTWIGSIAVLGLPMMLGILLFFEERHRAPYLLGPLLVMSGLLCLAIASGMLPRVRHIDARKSIFSGCGRKWLEQFPER